MHELIKLQKQCHFPNRAKLIIEEYEEMQNEIRTENESKDNASKLRIWNFYNNKIGKNYLLLY